ncbi:hypothetical protein Dda_7644 [Drechslerella dactyloides]|uniref:Uncharacterized protein n=1 Tax=Drechslerella dactyloides TaxID=74499 RepID=A0AAD6ISJ5_DREDA|nr:hypothetical protein Dda_7644 [Drechslerella dactyloides]
MPSPTTSEPRGQSADGGEIELVERVLCARWNWQPLARIVDATLFGAAGLGGPTTQAKLL